MMNSEIVKKAKAGDAQALEDLYADTRQMVYFTALGIIKNEQDAQDLVQDTYIKAFQNISKLESENAFITWLKTIAVNVCKNYLNKKKPSLFKDDEEEDFILGSAEEISEDFLPQEYLDQAEKRQTIKEIIDGLPDTQRTAVMLYYYDELPLSEVSKIMETADGTTKSRLNYARKQIKTKVEEQEKKGNKLYAGVPMLTKILHMVSQNYDLPAETAKHILANSLQAANIPLGTASTAPGAGSGAANQAAGHASAAAAKTGATKGILAKIAGMTVKTRVIALLSAGIVVAGIGTGAVVAVKQKQAADQAAVVLQQKQKEAREKKEEEEAAAKKTSEQKAASSRNAEAQNSALMQKLCNKVWHGQSDGNKDRSSVYFASDGKCKVIFESQYSLVSEATSETPLLHEEYTGTFRVTDESTISINCTSYTKNGKIQPYKSHSSVCKVEWGWGDPSLKNYVLANYGDSNVTPMYLMRKSGILPSGGIPDSHFALCYVYASELIEKNPFESTSSAAASSGSSSETAAGGYATDFLGMTLKQLTDKYGSGYKNYGNETGGAYIGYEDKRLPYRFGLNGVSLNPTDKIVVVEVPDGAAADSKFKGGMTLSEVKAAAGSSFHAPVEGEEAGGYVADVDRSFYYLCYGWNDKSCTGKSWTEAWLNKNLCE